MYLGHMVELAESAELYRNPIHPYTEMLLSAIPIADPDLSAARKRIKLEGESRRVQNAQQRLAVANDLLKPSART